MANKKAVIGGVAAILLVAAVVAVVATRKDGNDSPHFSTTSKSVTESSNMVSVICASTDYKDSCEKTLTKALNGGSTDPKSVIEAAVNATIDEVRGAFEISGNITVDISDPVNHMAVADCKKLMNDAIDDLRAVLELAQNETSWPKRADDIKTWLSAVISYQSSCVDGFNNAELKDAVDKAVRSAVEFTSNAIAIFKQYTSLGKDIDLGVDFTPSKRRLMSLPSWLSTEDRRLLAAAPRGPVVKPNVVVAKDGSGDFKTVGAAIAAIPKVFPGRYVIYVKAGTYNEQVLIDNKKPNIFMYGDGARKTIITASKSVAISKVTTTNSATFAVEAAGFIASGIGFANTAGPDGEQAVALRVKGDKAAFFNCRMDAFQDTLYVQANRQFYRNCVVSGTVDFIFGDSATVMQNCLILVRKPGPGQSNMVTAHGRIEKQETTGLVIQNCRILPDSNLFPTRLTVPTYLGRPWKAYSRTIIMESQIGDLIRPEGWAPWNGNLFLNTLYYAEYANTGPGANTAGRVKWPGYRGVISRQEAEVFTAGSFIDQDKWIGTTGAKYFRGFKN